MATGLEVHAEPSFPPASSPNDSVANEHAESRSLSQVLREANNNRCIPCQTKHDIALVFRNDEEDVADSIKEEMKKLAYNGKPLNLDVRLFSDEAAFGSNTVAKPYIVCESCRIMFIVHTSDDNRDLDSLHFASEEVIAEVRIIRGQDNVLPLHTNPGLRPPIGLACMSPMKWFQEEKRSEKLLGIIDYQRKKRGEIELLPRWGESELLQRLENLKLSDEDAYKMTGDPKGVCIIINNFLFDDPYYNRYSSQGESGKLEQLFKGLKFNVFGYENQTKEEMMGIFQKFSQSNCGNCLICFLMSHGRYNEVMSKDCKPVNIEEIASFFRPKACPALDGKPKCFFVDSCRLLANTDMPDAQDNDDPDVSTAQNDNPDQLHSTDSWDSLSESDKLSRLQERLSMYKEAIVNAKATGDGGEQKRLNRGIKTLNDLCKHPQSVKEEDIPPLRAVGNTSGKLPNFVRRMPSFALKLMYLCEVMSKDCKPVNIEAFASLFRPKVCPALDANIDMPDAQDNDDPDVSTTQNDNPDELLSTASWNSLPESDKLSRLQERLAMYKEALISAKDDKRKQKRLNRGIKTLNDLCKLPQSVKEEDIPPPVAVGNTSGKLPSKSQNEDLWTKDQVQDFFFGYATQENDTSLRSNEHGDIYTDEFIKAMEERAHKEDLVSIMTTVTRQVKKRTIYDKFGKKCWQLPKFDTLLNKKLYFNL